MNKEHVIAHLEMCASLMEEAAELLDVVLPEVFSAIRGRHPLRDELVGAAGMAREDAATMRSNAK